MTLAYRAYLRLLKEVPALYDVRAVAELLNRRALPKVECPICGYQGRLRMFGYPPRVNALCPKCLSLERQRLLYLYLQDNRSCFEGRRILHFAPSEHEKSVRQRIAAIADLTGCDLFPQPGDRRIDIERIDLADRSVDLVVCFEVLEHVDHRKALAELSRIVRPGGRVLITVPLIEGWDTTYENPTIVSEHDRLIHFGQADHVRMFGADVREHICGAGFRLSEFTAQEPAVSKYGLTRGQKIFVAIREN